jgi:TetR/AcrR family transcriptional regulator, transcriptional repressor for nem operon
MRLVKIAFFSFLEKKFKKNLENIPTSMYLCSMIDTRDKILAALFRNIHRNGYQGLRADKVVAEMGITKGALYHYFPSKMAIGQAVIDEVIAPNYLRFYQQLDLSDAHPLDMLKKHLFELLEMASDEDIDLGCPLNNLVQELSPIEEHFRLSLYQIIEAMYAATYRALERGKVRGEIKPNTDSKAVAHFYLAAIEGAYSMAKVAKKREVFSSNMQQLMRYLELYRQT